MPTPKTKTITVNPADETSQVHAWVKAAQAGNRASFERLADKYYSAIFRMVYYRTHNRMDAEDITQDVFTKAYKGLGRLTDANRFKGWLFQIAVNRVRDFHRRKKLTRMFTSLSDDSNEMQPDQIESTNPGPYDLLVRQRFHQESKIFLARLSKIEKDVFMLRFFDQLQLNEIATALKRSESTIKTHLYRALAKFKNDHSFRKFLKGA
jgi:RNA polymerase sigma-70 factor (ECF subfamily)